MAMIMVVVIPVMVVAMIMMVVTPVVVVTIVVPVVLVMLLAPVIARFLTMHFPLVFFMCAHFPTEVLFTLMLVECTTGRIYVVIPAIGYKVDGSATGVVFVTMFRPVPLVAPWHV